MRFIFESPSLSPTAGWEYGWCSISVPNDTYSLQFFDYRVNYIFSNWNLFRHFHSLVGFFCCGQASHEASVSCFYERLIMLHNLDESVSITSGASFRNIWFRSFCSVKTESKR